MRTEPGSPDPGQPLGRPPRAHWLVFIGLAATIVLADQLTKAVVTANLQPGEVVAVLDDLLRITYSQNNGAIFGLFQEQALLFALISIGVLGLIVWFEWHSGSSLIISLALGLLLGGAIGNLIDRLRFGYVVDWVDMGIGDWRFYTYNVADAAITMSLLLLIASALLPLGRPAGARAGDA